MEYKKVPQAINDVVGDNVQLLAQLFPAAVKDGLVDFEALREELGEFQEVDAEKYELTWSGKQAAKKLAQQDVVNRTLRFVPEDSKNADTTENLYMEGDNLEVLKLLRQNYYGAIKMIYIDPPYNTGNDFVYNDTFVMDRKQSDIAEGASDGDGNPLQKNEKSKNRFHAKWLNMLYPRLKLCKELLTMDGFIAVSIGEEELDNLIKICNEVFGELNFRNIIATRRYDKNLNRQFMDEGLSTMNVGLEYILIYSKTISAKMEPVFREASEERASTGYWKGFWNGADRPTMRYDVLGFTPQEGQWKWKRDLAIEAVQNYIEYSNDFSADLSIEEYWEQTGKTKRFLRRNPNGKGKNQGVEHWVAPSDGILRNSNWSDYLSSKPTGVDTPFDSPKNSDVLMELQKLIADNSSCVLDFFSGSASTAHATMQLNAEDGGKRKFIMVQYPEETDNNTPANDAGYKNICEIGKERIRRAGEKILADNAGKEGIEQLDVGFRVFRTADTNIRWNLYEHQDGEQVSVDTLQSTPDLADFTEGFNDIDVVYEIMLRQRDIPLSNTLETLTDIGVRTYLYASTYLVCLETNITPELIEALASLDPLPVKFVFRDSAFGDDINLKDETFRRLKTLVERNTGSAKKTYTVEFI